MSRNASTEIGLLDVSRVYLLVRLDALTVLETPTDTSAKSFFSEIVASISDIKSTPDGRYIVSRDYMTLKLWDVNMEARPVKTVNVHEHLRPQVRLNIFLRVYS